MYARVLALTDFRFLWIGQIFSQFAFNTLLFVLALRVYQNTSSNTAVSGLFLAHGIPAVIFGMIAGAAVDRLDKRRVLVYCDIIRALCTFGLLFVSNQVAVVYLITFINSIITQLYVPSEAPLIPKLVPNELLVTANSLFSLTFFSSLAIGTIVSGPLMRGFGPDGVFVFIGCLFLLSSFFSSRIPSQSKGTIGIRYIITRKFSDGMRRIWADLTEGIAYTRSSPILFDSILLLTGTQIIFALLGALGPGFADRILTIDVRDASLLIVGPTVLGILCGVVWVGSVGYKHKPEQLITWGILGAGISLVSIAVIAHLMHVPQFAWLSWYNIGFIVEVILFFGLGVSNSFLDVPSNSNMQSYAIGPMRGRVYGMLTTFVGGVGIIPIVVGGFLADTVGVGKVILSLGLAIGLFGMYRVRYSRKV